MEACGAVGDFLEFESPDTLVGLDGGVAETRRGGEKVFGEGFGGNAGLTPLPILDSLSAGLGIRVFSSSLAFGESRDAAGDSCLKCLQRNKD